MTIEKIPFKQGELSRSMLAIITRAAINCGDVVYTGWRHAQIMDHLRVNKIVPRVTMAMQGFVCEEGIFWSRLEAWRIVTGSGQLRHDRSGMRDELISEQLWDNDGQPWPDHMTISDILNPPT